MMTDDKKTFDLAEALDQEVPELDGKSDAAEKPKSKALGACGDKRTTQQSILLDAIAGQVQLFHTRNQEAFARFQREGRLETRAVDSPAFTNWLRLIFYQETGKGPSQATIGDVKGVLRAKAQFENEQRDVHIRCARHDDAVFVDLCDADWRQVRIDSDGWAVVSSDQSPVIFTRSDSMEALPIPADQADLDGLREILNLEQDKDFVLLVSWLLGALKPEGPFPILLLQGEQGSAKSTTARIIKSLIDPSAMPLATMSSGERDLVLMASQCWCLNFDNLSGLKTKMADALCRLSSGGGFATRKLYSDSEQKVFNAKKPVIMNGISDLATRHDLADRSIVVTLPAIHPTKRRTEREIRDQLTAIRPRVLAALYLAVSKALARENTISLGAQPRMADFAVWVCASEEALPWEDGMFMKYYEENRKDIIDIALEADPVATAIIEVMGTCIDGEWSGSASDLLSWITAVIPEDIRRLKSWPKTPSVLSNRVQRCATYLREKGFTVERHHSGTRTLTIRKLVQRVEKDTDLDYGKLWSVRKPDAIPVEEKEGHTPMEDDDIDYIFNTFENAEADLTRADAEMYFDLQKIKGQEA